MMTKNRLWLSVLLSSCATASCGGSTDEKANPAGTGGTNTSTGGSGQNTGGTSSNTGGTSNNTGGTSNNTGGAPRGGEPSSGGGVETSEGGAVSATGGRSGGGAAGVPAGGQGSAGESPAAGAPSGGASDAGAGGRGECVPTTCAAVNACGGQISDGCGVTLQCPPCQTDACDHVSTLQHARAAKSEGFSGTVEQYFELYDAPCDDVSDCAQACSQRGGAQPMCAASECIEGFSGEPNHCLPATAWRNFEALRSEGTDPPLDGAELVLVYNPYHDKLLVSEFNFEIPADATIKGIEVTVRRAADSTDAAVDESVRLIKAGQVGTADRSKPQKWGTAFEAVVYGGPTDLWGLTWTPADVNAAAFGVALSALYTQSAGNGRAYVDIVQARVHYRSCD